MQPRKSGTGLFRPVTFGKRAAPDLDPKPESPPRQLLRNPTVLDTELPLEVKRYFAQDCWADQFVVAQWSVDKEEPQVLRALYEKGFKGPVCLKDVASQHILPALCALDGLQLAPMVVRLEFQNRVLEHHVEALARLLWTPALRVETLQLDLSSDLSVAAVTSLMKAMRSLIESTVCSITVDGKTQSRIPDGFAQAILNCEWALRWKPEALIPLLLIHPEKLLHPEMKSAAALKAFLEDINGQLRGAPVQSQRKQNFLWFKQAVCHDELNLLKAFKVLDLAPGLNDHLDFSNVLPLPQALQLLKQWGIPIHFFCALEASAGADEMGQKLQEQRPLISAMELTLKTAIGEDHWLRLLRGLHGLGSKFQRLTLTVEVDFAIRPLANTSSKAGCAAGVPVLQLVLRKVAKEKASAYSAAVVQLIQATRPMQLDLVVPATSVALHVLKAFPTGCHFTWMESLNIQSREVDTTGPLTLEALKACFGRFHGPTHVSFEGNADQWSRITVNEVRDMVLNNDRLIEVSLYDQSRLKGNQRKVIHVDIPPAVHLRERVFTRGKLQLDMAASGFFSHLHKRFTADLGQKVIEFGELSEHDQQALALVSTTTHAAGVQGRKVVALAQALMDRTLDAPDLSELLTQQPSGLRDTSLAQALVRYVDQQTQRAHKNQLNSLDAWRAIFRLVVEEEAQWNRQATERLV